MSDRGIKKWAPYKSLIEQTDSLRDLDESYKVDVRPTLSEDEQERINDILVNYQGEELEFKYYKNHRILTIRSIIKKFDLVNRVLILEDNIKIPLKDIVGLK